MPTEQELIDLRKLQDEVNKLKSNLLVKETQKVDDETQEVVDETPDTNITGDLTKIESFVQGGKGVASIPTKVIEGNAEFVNWVINPLIGLGDATWQFVTDGEWNPELINNEYFSEDIDLTPSFLDLDERATTAKVATDLSTYFTNYGLIKSGVKSIPYINQKIAQQPKKKLTVTNKISDFTKGTAKELTIGALADVVTFDIEDGTAVDALVETFPNLSNPVFDYLTTEENDTDAEIRFKQVLEGMGLGLAAETVMKGLSAFARNNKKTVADYKANKQQERDILVQQNKIGCIGDDELQMAGVTLTKSEKSESTKYRNRVEKEGTPKNQILVDKDKLKNLLKNKRNKGKTLADTAPSNLPINVKNFKSSADAIQAIDYIVSVMDPAYTKKWDATLTNRETAKLARMYGTTEEVLISGFTKMYNVEELPWRLIATKQVLQGLGEEAQRLGRLFSTETASSVEEAEFFKVLALTMQVTDDLKTFTKSVARTQQAGRIKVGARKLNIDNISNLAKQMQSDKMSKGDMKKFAAMIANADDFESIRHASERSLKARVWDATTELYINGLLAGPITQLINVVSSGLETIYRPAEKIIGGAAISPFSRTGRLAVVEGFSAYRGMIKNFDDTLRMAAKAFSTEDLVGDQMGRIIDTAIKPRAFSASNLGVQNPIAGTAINAIGATIRLPSRFLTTGDELIKQINYRAELHRLAYKNGLEQNLTGKKLNVFVSKFEKNGFDDLGRFTNEEAKKYSRSITFTDDLASGADFNVGGYIQQGVKTFPLLRVILPFVRTPTNLWRHQIARLPITGVLHKQNKDLWKAGGTARAEVLGRQILAGAMLAKAYDLVNSGHITGSGPANPTLNAAWQLEHKPYSFKIENDDGTTTWKAYNRMDPRYSVFGIVADIYYSLEHHNEPEVSDAVVGTLVSVISNLSSKSYLKGFVDISTAVAMQSEDMIDRIIYTTISNYVPLTGLTRQINDWQRGNEACFYEVRNLVDRYKSNTFWDSDDLKCKRNLLGEVIYKPQTPLIGGSPSDGDILLPVIKGKDNYMLPIIDFTIGRVSIEEPDAVKRELSKLAEATQGSEGRTISPQSKKLTETLNGGSIDLTAEKYIFTEGKYKGYTPYDAMMAHLETYTTTENNPYRGLTVKQALAKLFDSEQYKKAGIVGDTYINDERVKLIRKIYNTYKNSVKAEIIEMHPMLKNDILIARGEKEKSKVLQFIIDPKTSQSDQEAQRATIDDTINQLTNY